VLRRLSPQAFTGFLLLLVCYGYFLPNIDNVNSTSRMNLVYAVADRGTLHIDEFHKNTIDKAFFDGHYYMEKSIGPSVVALPVYLAFRKVGVSTGLLNPPHFFAPQGGYTRGYHGTALIVVTFLTVSVPSAVAAAALYAFVRRWVTATVALVTMLGYGLATIAFPYSSQFYSHQLAASTMFLAFFLLWRVVKEGAPLREAWGAGALMGLAVITEYVTVAFAVFLLIWVVYSQRSMAVVTRVSAAALPWGLLAAAYNLAAFRTPLPAGYAHTVHFGDVHEQGVMGLTTPSLTTLYGITFSPYRGLFFLSPFLLLAFIGLWRMWKENQRPLAVLVGSICATLVLYNASYVMWTGGFAIGPRHLIPMLPFLCLPVAWALQAASARRPWRAGAAVLIIVSVANVWIHTLGGPDFPPETAMRPLTQYALPNLLHGNLSFNAGMLLGLEGHVSLIPWAVAAAVAVVAALVLHALRTPETAANERWTDA
jgi:4-amino-4-deoxy-L-arabinose transferase-like glycosyltransferase